MKTLIHWTLVVMLTGFSSLAYASPPAELNLWKHDPFHHGLCGHCGDFISFEENKNRADITDFELYLQTGSYSAVLYGPANATMTLFGEQNYALAQGYLILVKKDDAVVQIENLEEFVPGKWVDVKAQKGWSGAYSVYYQPYPMFKKNVQSGKWGKWWTTLPHLPGPTG